jgi:hypothetical protein
MVSCDITLAVSAAQFIFPLVLSILHFGRRRTSGLPIDSGDRSVPGDFSHFSSPRLNPKFLSDSMSSLSFNLYLPSPLFVVSELTRDILRLPAFRFTSNISGEGFFQKLIASAIEKKRKDHDLALILAFHCIPNILSHAKASTPNVYIRLGRVLLDDCTLARFHNGQ